MTEGAAPAATTPDAGLRAVRPRDPHRALGMAAAFLMSDPAFQGLRFGHWTRVLAGQIRRGHYLFVTDRQAVVGLAGWSLAETGPAEAWLTSRRELSFDESRAGDIVIVNVWKATTPAANGFLVDAFRRLFHRKRAVYYKRFYANGRVRPVRLRVNNFVERHLKAHDASLDRPDGVISSSATTVLGTPQQVPEPAPPVAS
jgi:hemolysin-activating ACP:hemolysin acyltransferase